MHRPSRQALVVLALLTSGCPAKVEESAGNTGTAEEPVEEFRARAHEKALQIALPLAEAALVLEDPVGAAQLGLGDLAPEPIDPGALARLRDAHTKAWREVEQIDGQQLDTKSIETLSALQVGLTRIAMRLERQSPGRFDPGWAVATVERFLDEAEHRLTRGDSGCAAGLHALADAFATAGRELGASSPESLNAAREDLRSIRARLLRFPELRSPLDETHTKALEAAVAALDELLELTEARIARLGEAKTGAWGEPVPPARDGPTLVKLPPQVGAAELRKRLWSEEAIAAPAEQLFGRAAASLTKLEALARRARASDPLPPGRAALVDRERCEAVASRVIAWAAQTRDETLSVRCDAVVRSLGKQALDDADLLVHIVGSEVVEPLRRERRKNAQRPLALVSGHIAPASHRRAAILGVLAAMGETDALRRAVASARDDLCLAAAALWFHAELGDDAALRQRLAPHCDSRKASAWTGLAAARPRRALRGLGLASFDARGPAESLDALWWGPLGLPSLIAEATSKRPPPKGLTVNIEELKPTAGDE